MLGAISQASRNSRGDIQVTERLRRELNWTFLREWQGMVEWRNETHVQVCLGSNASSYKRGAGGWGDGLVKMPDASGDYWQAATRGQFT